MLDANDPALYWELLEDNNSYNVNKFSCMPKYYSPILETEETHINYIHVNGVTTPILN